MRTIESLLLAIVTAASSAGPRRTLALWIRRRRTRRALARLTADELRDVGLTPEQAARETAKPFWAD